MAFVEYSGEIVSEKKKDEPFKKDSSGFQVGTQDDLKERVGNDWWHLPAATIGGVGLGLAGKAVYDWFSSKNKPADMQRVEPTFTQETIVEQPKAASPMEILQERKRQIMEGVKPPVEQPAYTPQFQSPRNQAWWESINAPNAPQGDIPPAPAAPTAGAPVQPPMAPAAPQQAAPAIADAVAAGESPAKAIQMDVAKQIEAAPMVPPPEAPAESGIKKRAAKTPVTFKSAEKLPEGISFRADLGPGDNWLFNTYGPEGRKAILQQFNEGKPAVSYERAKELSQLLQQERIGPSIPRDLAKERGIAPPETNYGKLGKAVKVAGVAGLGLTAAQLAQAAQQAQQGNLGAAREFGFNLLGMIPGLGAAFNMGTYAPELGAGEQKELAKRRRMAPTID